MNSCLLLTATVNVQNKALIQRTDPAARLNDYKQALTKWLTKQQSLTSIVFVENSGYPLDDLKKIVADNNPYNKRVEFLSFAYSGVGDTDISMGEIRAIEYAMKHSELLAASKKFVKVTGRVFVNNIDAIMSGVCEDFHIIARLSENLMYCDSAAVMFDTACYKEVIQDFVIREMNAASERIDFESVYARAIHHALSKNYRWYPFPQELVLAGISGTKGVSYASRYGFWRGLRTNLISAKYHKIFRTAYSKTCGREHLLSRWSVPPKM